MIQVRMIAATIALPPLDLGDRFVDVGAGQHPIIVEIGDHLLHEAIREPDGAGLVAEVIVEDRQRQLLRALAFVGPLEAPGREGVDIIVLGEFARVDRDQEPVERAFAFIGFHTVLASYRRAQVDSSSR